MRNKIEQFVIAAVGEDALEQLVQAMLDYDVPPVFLWHSNVTPVAVAREDVRQRLIQALDDLPDDERTRITSAAPGQTADLPSDLLHVATSARFFAIPDALFSPPSSASRVLQQLPGLAGKMDEDGLLDITGLDARPQIIVVNGYGLHYHQFLRRGVTSHVNYHLIGVLLEAASAAGVTLRVAIDERRLKEAAHHRDYFEKDYWFGPPLSRDRLDDPRSVGPTTHWGRDVNLLLQPYVAFLARWSLDRKTGMRVCEMEELISPDAKSPSRYVLCRYLHAIRNCDRHIFVHCDGAVRAYERDQYEDRIAEAGRRTAVRPVRYRKVFRLDGPVKTDTWSEIVAKWFRENELAREYLSGLAGSNDALA